MLQGKKNLAQDEIFNKSYKKKQITQKQLSCIKKAIDKCSYASSSTSDTSLPWDSNIDVLDCKTLIPPVMEPSTIKPPTPNTKICIHQAPNARCKITPSKFKKLSLTRRYHKKIPELKRNDTFFTIQGYSLPPSMSHITKFAPRTPNNHEHLRVVRRPLFQEDVNSSCLTPIIAHPFKTIIRSKSRLSRDYINRARDRVERIDKFCKNWPCKIDSLPKNTKSLKVELENHSQGF